jgi:peptidoglycan/LPS O-acetylase OafA/YrhL
VLYFAFPYVREWGQPSSLWRYLTFTLNFGLDLKKYSTFSHAWSLCVEEQFYLILPLCFWLFTFFKAGKKAIYLIAALFIGGFVIRIWCWDHQIAPLKSPDNMRALWNQYVYYPTYNRLDGLLVGVSIAGLFTFYPKVKAWANRYNIALMIAGLTALVAANFVCADRESFNTGTFGFPLVSLAYGMILAAMVCPGNFLFKRRSGLTSLIATLSYSLYLVHKIVIHLTQTLLAKAGMDINGTPMMIICIGTSILAALLMRYAIEKPALKLRDKVLQHWNQKKAKEAELACEAV